MEDQTQIQIKIQSREKTLYDGPAVSIASENETGPFSILPYHANFITLLKKEITVTDPEGKAYKFPVNNGVLRVENNKVEVFLGVRLAS